MDRKGYDNLHFDGQDSNETDTKVTLHSSTSNPGSHEHHVIFTRQNAVFQKWSSFTHKLQNSPRLALVLLFLFWTILTIILITTNGCTEKVEKSTGTPVDTKGTTPVTSLSLTSTCVPDAEYTHLLEDSERRSFENTTFTLVRMPRVSWYVAVTICEKVCSVLTGIGSQEEFTFLKRFIDEENSAWVGGTILNRTRYEWIENGEPIQDFVWRKGEPSNGYNIERCVDLYSHRVTGANDNRCDDLLPFICKSNQD